MKKNFLLLLTVIVFGGALRFYNLNWDYFLIFHPDERNIANAVTKIIFFSHMNPGFFAYGAFPIYLYRITGDFLNLFNENGIWVYDWGHINLIGRYYSAIFSTLTILVVYLIGKKLWSVGSGLIAATIFAFLPSAIQLSHYATTESLLILIVAVITYLSILYLEKPRFKTVILLGIISGVGIASKTTAASFLLTPLLSFVLVYFKKYNKKKLIFQLVIFFTLSSAVFTLLSPYTFLDFNKFKQSMEYESGVVTGSLPVPYTHQFDHAIPYLYEIGQYLFEMGPIFIASLLGFLFICFITVKKRKVVYLSLIVFPLFYFIYVGSWHAKFIRYQSPLFPFYFLYASFFLYSIYKKVRMLGIILIFLFLLLTILWALAFINIYSNPQTRIQASKWIYKNIKPNSRILEEHWDDGLPVSIGENTSEIYNISQLTIYDNEFKNKSAYYAAQLSSADYIVLTTRRLYGTLIYLPDTYPTTSKYYKRLFNGSLGYKNIATFSSYPQLFGIIINDDRSEESFQVYDHPTVLIFKNEKHLSYKQLLNLLH